MGSHTTTGPMNKTIEQLRRAVLIDGTGLSDGQLLECFVKHQDEAAMEALVRRHGPMVFGVCRRILCHWHDAEDAFQATFLVLVRRAASVVPREMVANWLYGVAYRTAMKARATTGKRRRTEPQVAELPEPAAAPQDPDLGLDLQLLLDRELSCLPDKYRIPLVLCDLEGKPRKEVARQLGWPEGTLSGRLARARKLLADRLARRGLVVPVGLLAVVLSRSAASACVPTSLLVSTVTAASQFAAGPTEAGVISAPVVTLAEGVLKAMLLTKVKIATAVVLAVGLLLSGVGLTLWPSAAALQAADVQKAIGDNNNANAQHGDEQKNDKDDGDKNNKDDGDKNNKDDGQKNDKDDGQKNNKEDGDKNNKDDGDKNPKSNE